MAIYAWEKDCIKALLETDRGLIPSRISAAKLAIFERMNRQEPIGLEERAELEYAMVKLNALEQEQRG